jgi:hypothetical protein
MKKILLISLILLSGCHWRDPEGTLELRCADFDEPTRLTFNGPFQRAHFSQYERQWELFDEHGNTSAVINADIFNCEVKQYNPLDFKPAPAAPSSAD